VSYLNRGFFRVLFLKAFQSFPPPFLLTLLFPFADAFLPPQNMGITLPRQTRKIVQSPHLDPFFLNAEAIPKGPHFCTVGLLQFSFGLFLPSHGLSSTQRSGLFSLPQRPHFLRLGTKFNKSFPPPTTTSLILVLFLSLLRNFFFFPFLRQLYTPTHSPSFLWFCFVFQPLLCVTQTFFFSLPELSHRTSRRCSYSPWQPPLFFPLASWQGTLVPCVGALLKTLVCAVPLLVFCLPHS